MKNIKYISTIGIECHVQLKTKTKLFSAVSNDARGASPNSLISHIDAGMPGALPVLNSAAVELGIVAALAFGVEPQKFSKFERKHYFYPDLPKGYQITQYEDPIIVGGHLDFAIDGKSKRVGIARAHLEEDAGKNTHPAGADYSLVDLNRAGTPLLEIVTQPDMHSPAEAKQLARELWLVMKYAGVTDGDLYHGHMRFDMNVSISSDEATLGTRTETKNLNSFRSVENAAAYEIKRQIDILEKGGEVIQETRGWDEAKQKTVSQRGKEEAEDYRYMPEPDIPPLVLDKAQVDKVRAQMSELPGSIRQKLTKLEISKNVIEDILDRPAVVFTVLKILEQASVPDAKRAAFWLIGAQSPEVTGEIEPELEPKRVIELSQMVESGDLSSSAAKQVFNELLSSADEPVAIAKRLNLLQVSNQAEIENHVKQAISQNPKVVADIKAGNKKATGFLVGQVMDLSGGRANPEMVAKSIDKILNK
ncbi:MAG: Asp-tRNA(Asn)/Glu-tRNA(Gln) amidotransferase subunit GatB [Candidatus Saccharimonadales bacterium]